jgi:hypothetical protein
MKIFSTGKNTLIKKPKGTFRFKKASFLVENEISKVDGMQHNELDNDLHPLADYQ